MMSSVNINIAALYFKLCLCYDDELSSIQVVAEIVILFWTVIDMINAYFKLCNNDNESNTSGNNKNNNYSNSNNTKNNDIITSTVYVTSNTSKNTNLKENNDHDVSKGSVANNNKINDNSDKNSGNNDNGDNGDNDDNDNHRNDKNDKTSKREKDNHHSSSSVGIRKQANSFQIQKIIINSKMLQKQIQMSMLDGYLDSNDNRSHFIDNFENTDYQYYERSTRKLFEESTLSDIYETSVATTHTELHENREQTATIIDHDDTYSFSDNGNIVETLILP